MDKRRKKGNTTMNPNMFQGASLREEITGKKHVDANSMRKIEYLQKLATWASGESSIASLAALYGHRLAAAAEAEGIPVDPSVFLCHRCETVLKPGFNCTVHVLKNVKKTRRRKKSHIPSQNNVIYKCHFCCHPNILRGTPTCHVKGLLASRSRCNSAQTIINSKKGTPDEKQLESNMRGEFLPREETISEMNRRSAETNFAVQDTSVEKTPLTPLLGKISKKKRKGNASAPSRDSVQNSSGPMTSGEGTGGSKKRKRKGWSSLKEITNIKEAEHNQSISNFAIPFLLPIFK